MRGHTIPTDWLSGAFPDLLKITPLDAGGQKQVFTCQHPEHGDVVLKLFHAGSEPKRAIREIEAIRAINSIRIPRLIAFGDMNTPDGYVIWLLEEYLKGQSLRKVIQDGFLDTRNVLRIGRHVLECLTIAESVRIVHRDIKPENLIADIDRGCTWVLDFGIARHLDLQSLTATSDIVGIGTPGYSPPEQLRNLKYAIDTRTDIFALGVTLYECLTGVNPYREGARDAMEVWRRVETQDLPAYEGPEDIRELIYIFTQRQRNYRPPTAKFALDWIGDVCRSHGVD
ncbi:MAG: serine/threonine-protein kinase [Candidatus Thiodiazotropha sp.]